MSNRENRQNPYDEPEEGEILCFPNPSAYLNLLREVVLGSLPDDEQTCGICREPYGTGEVPETILILPCKHVFGSSCIHHWLSESHKNTCPICRAVLFEIEPERNPTPDANGEYRAAPEVRILLSTGTDHDLISAFHMVDNLIQAFPTLLRANQASRNWDGPPVTIVEGFPINRGHFVFASVQLLALFKSISERHFCIPQQYIDRLSFLMVRLAHNVREHLEESRIIEMWSVNGLPAWFLCHPQCQGMIKIALNRMIRAEEQWTVSVFSIDAEIRDSGLDRLAEDRQWQGRSV